MMSYKASIITPYGKIFDETVEHLSAPGESGGFGILTGHAPIIATLARGVVSLKHEGRERFFSITPGVLEVRNSGDLVILTDRATEASSADEAKSQIKI